MAIAALHEDNVVQNVEAQARDPNNEDEQLFLGLLRVDEPLDSLHEDAEHERGGEDGVAESAQHVRPAEAVGAGLVPPDAAEAHADQPDDHGDQVGQHSEGVRGQGEGIAHVGHRDLDGENGNAHHAHEDEAAAAAGVAAHSCRSCSSLTAGSCGDGRVRSSSLPFSCQCCSHVGAAFIGSSKTINQFKGRFSEICHG